MRVIEEARSEMGGGGTERDFLNPCFSQEVVLFLRLVGGLGSGQEPISLTTF